jgi:hypothetical protein
MRTIIQAQPEFFVVDYDKDNLIYMPVIAWAIFNLGTTPMPITVDGPCSDSLIKLPSGEFFSSRHRFKCSKPEIALAALKRWRKEGRAVLAESASLAPED